MGRVAGHDICMPSKSHIRIVSMTESYALQAALLGTLQVGHRVNLITNGGEQLAEPEAHDGTSDT